MLTGISIVASHWKKSFDLILLNIKLFLKLNLFIFHFIA